MKNVADTIQNYNTIYKNLQDVIIPNLCGMLYINDKGNWNLDSNDEIFVFYSEVDVNNFIYYEGYNGPHFFDNNCTHIVCIRLQSYDDECYNYFTLFIDANILESENWIEQLQEKYKSIFDRYHKEYTDRIYLNQQQEKEKCEKEYQEYLKLKEKFKEREMNTNENKNRMAGENLGKLVS